MSKRGKHIYITRNEASAVSSAVNDIRHLIESGASEEYVENSLYTYLQDLEVKLTRNGLFYENN